MTIDQSLASEREILEQFGASVSGIRGDSESNISGVYINTPESAVVDSLKELKNLSIASLVGFPYVPELPSSVTTLRYSYPSSQKLSQSCWGNIQALMKNLVFLELAGCGLTELPPWLEKAKNLTILDVSNNNFTRWPANVPDNVIDFSLRNNQISEFPAKTSIKTYKFEHLDLANNKFNSLSSYLHIRQLRHLDMSGNLFTKLPSYLTGWQVKKSGYVDVSEQNTDNPLTETKIAEMNEAIKEANQSRERNEQRRLLAVGDINTTKKNMADKKLRKFADFRGNQIEDLGEGWDQLEDSYYSPTICF